jgi:hypothetical protein
MPVRCTGKEKYVYIPYCRNTIAPAITITGRVEQKKCETDSEVVLHLDTLCAANIRLTDYFGSPWLSLLGHYVTEKKHYKLIYIKKIGIENIV